jgi:hypothetical protein
MGLQIVLLARERTWPGTALDSSNIGHGGVTGDDSVDTSRELSRAAQGTALSTAAGCAAGPRARTRLLTLGLGWARALGVVHVAICQYYR